MLTRLIKKPVFLIPITMSSAIGLVTLLAWVALRPINQKNGFNRRFIADKLTQLEVVKKNEAVVGIAGTTAHHIYFKTKDPAKLWVTDLNLKDGQYITLNVPNNQRIASAFYTFVDSPTVHIMAGNGPAIIKADLNNCTQITYRFPTSLFTRGVVIGPNSYVFRGFDTADKKSGQIFIKGNPQTGELARNKNITGKVTDAAGIMSDGYLNYDDYTNLLVYVSYYRNKFFCMDTNLNLKYTGHTIDTVSNYQIQAAQVGNSITNTSPARIINGKSHTSNGTLYINSKLQGDNESAEKFNSRFAVDIYDIQKVGYKGSFYIPFYKRQKVLDFRTLGNSIIVIYKKGYIAMYQLPLAMTK